MSFQSSCQRIRIGWLVNAVRLILISVICLCFISPAGAAPKGAACQDKHLKVAVISGGIQKNTSVYFLQVLKRLGENGFIAKAEIPWSIDLKNRSDYKTYISDAVKGKCLEFPEEFSFFLNWEVSLVKDRIEELRTAAKTHEIDLVLSLGDLSAKFLIEEKLDVPVICFDTNSTVKLRELAKDNKNYFFLDDSRNIKDDIRLFYKMFGYTSFGYLRDRNHLFDLYSIYDDVLAYTIENNIPFSVCEGSFFVPDEKAAHAEFSRCMKELSTKNINAVFLPEVGNGIDMHYFYSQLRPLIAKKIAVVSSDSKAQVEAGSLFSSYDPEEITRSGYIADVIGDLVLNDFNADTIATKKELVIPLFLGINLKTASLVQWRPAFDVLVAVDDVFHTIKSF